MVKTSPTLARTATLFRELQDLKRLVPANFECSIATHLFRQSWQAILSGTAPEQLALDVTVRALLAILFPGVDDRFFRAAGMDIAAAQEVFTRALQRTASGRIGEEFYLQLLTRLPNTTALLTAESVPNTELPGPLEILCRQPRAGATHPDLPRLVLEPAEMHSDHCLLTAVYGVLMADRYGADYGTVFLASLAHHLHNAYLPDCGYAGEICLGAHLTSVIENCRREALSQFPTHLRPRITEALEHHESIAGPEGRAVSAGDVLDRVLDVQWRTRAAAVTDRDILGELDLVHPGPLKDFQTELLAKTEVWKG